MEPQHDTLSDNPDLPRAGRTVLLLLLLFCIGIMAITVINSVTSRLLKQLEQQGANERARQFIAEDISRTVTAMELDFLRMATSTSLRRQAMIREEINGLLKRVHQALHVLQQGGSFDRQVGLNLEGVDQMQHRVAYNADPDDTTNLLAAIELGPHLELIEAKAEQVALLLQRREQARETGSSPRFSAAEMETKLFFKETASLFVRLHENTNRIFYESATRMQQLETTLAVKEQRYRNGQALLVALVVLTVLIVGGLLGRQISVITNRLHTANRDLQRANRSAEAALSLSRAAEYEICLRLGRAAEFRDLETGQHTRRISEMAATLAALAGLSHDMVELVRLASPLHDVGKVGIPDQVLLKPGRLTDQEMQTIRLHTTLGETLLAEAGNYPSLELGRTIALQHHEKWDGSGYPNGLRGEDIDLTARIVTIVDIFDALLSERPYKKPFSMEQTVAIMKEGHGTFFDPQLLKLFLEHLPRFVAIRDRLQDNQEERQLAMQLLAGRTSEVSA